MEAARPIECIRLVDPDTMPWDVPDSLGAAVKRLEALARDGGK